MIREIDRYYYSKEEPVQSCLLALRNIILEHDSEVSETRKWSMPCFTYKKKMFCFLWTDKKTGEPYLLMVEGNSLNHPKLEKGERLRMKILRIRPAEDIPITTIHSILDDALDLEKKMVRIIPKSLSEESHSLALEHEVPLPIQDQNAPSYYGNCCT